jgi:isopentenyl-diphosphate delta-isomerase type 2
MNKNKQKDNSDAPRKQLQQEFEKRKSSHLEICLKEDVYQVEDTYPAGYDAVKFIHCALPELSYNELDTTLDFLGLKLSLPIFISGMTGGVTEAGNINRELALAAQELKIPFGLGSMRILFSQPEAFSQFYIKPLAPDIPVIANLGIVQLREIEHSLIIELCKRLEVQAVAIHLNPGQELFQPGGDRDFRGLGEMLQRFCARSPLPVIVKETGCGINPSLVPVLLSYGVKYVDLAGAGGTNWLLVEAARGDESVIDAVGEVVREGACKINGDVVHEETRNFVRQFDSWGLPTALLQAAVGDQAGRVLASGGIRTGLDVAKALALGANLAGLALPLIRAVVSQGRAGVLKYIRQMERALRTVMCLVGARTLTDLRRAPLLFDPAFLAQVEQLRARKM